MSRDQMFWLTEVNVTNNIINNNDIQNSYEHYNLIKKQDDIPYKIVNDYRQEVECSEWIDNPLTVSYKIMNWLLQRKITPQYNYIPEELKCCDISNEHIKSQLQNIEIMNNELHKFPTVTSSNSPQGINLFRGVSCDFINFESLRVGSQTTIDSFLSTSLFINTAIRFTGSSNCIMAIHIHPGTPLPFITNNLLYTGQDNVTSEAEVVIPIGATLLFSQKFNYHGFNIYCFELTSFRVETRQFWASYNTILETVWPHIEQVRIIQKQKEDEEERQEKESQDMDITDGGTRHKKAKKILCRRRKTKRKLNKKYYKTAKKKHINKTRKILK
jgi:hypothetical protein